MAFPQQGPKDWSPLWLDQVMEGLEQHTVDTDLRFKHQNKLIFGVADVTPDGKLSAYHVTDDPEIAKKAIERKDLRMRSYSGQSCPGLWVSALPREWRGLSRRKWDFLQELTEDKRIYLADKLEDMLRYHKMNGYITEWEMKRGVEWLKIWLETVNHETLIGLARQPYNINIPELAERQGLAEPFKPFVVQVIFEGRYLKESIEVSKILPSLTANHLKKPQSEVETADICRTLNDLGWDGLFIPTELGSPAELVIWNPEKILSYGLREDSPRLSGPGRGEGGTSHVGRRFETDLSPEGTVADLHEVANKSKMFSLMRLPAVLELRDVIEKITLGLEPEPGRFKVDFSKDLPAIVDTQVYRRFEKLSKEDLGELVILLDDLVVQMELVS